MNGIYSHAALFDFDGVVMDTEGQYSLFWSGIGKLYQPSIAHFEQIIKGMTLQQIFDKYFFGMLENERLNVVKKLNAFEMSMQYNYISGVVDFILDLRRNRVKTAVVTSSNELKMQQVYKSHPELMDLFDCIFTSEMYSRSKPHPDCFLCGADFFQIHPKQCVVFEDSFHGLEAARQAQMHVIGLATTHPRKAISGKADHVLDNFLGVNFEKVCQMCGFIH